MILRCGYSSRGFTGCQRNLEHLGDSAISLTVRLSLALKEKFEVKSHKLNSMDAQGKLVIQPQLWKLKKSSLTLACGTVRVSPTAAVAESM